MAALELLQDSAVAMMSGLGQAESSGMVSCLLGARWCTTAPFLLVNWDASSENHAYRRRCRTVAALFAGTGNFAFFCTFSIDRVVRRRKLAPSAGGDSDHSTDFWPLSSADPQDHRRGTGTLQMTIQLLSLTDEIRAA